MTSSSPLVSILMPFFNTRAHISEAIRSIFAQTHRPLEFIAIDDGSFDGAADLVRALIANADIPCQLESQRNTGPSGALRRALALASGEWVCWLAADDFYPPEFVARNLAAAYANGAENIVLHSNAFLIEEDGTVTGTSDNISELTPYEGDSFDLWLSGRGRMSPSTMFVRREFLLQIGGFNPQTFAEDIDLVPRLARAAPFLYLREPNFYSRHLPGSLGRRPWMWGQDAIVAITMHADRIGTSLPALLVKVSSDVAANCFEFGNIPKGLSWTMRAIGYSQGAIAKTNTAARLSARAMRGLTRLTMVKAIGRNRLVRAKRALVRK